MLHAGEVGLGGEGQQVVSVRLRRSQDATRARSLDSQFRGDHGDVGDQGPLAPGKLADAIDRVVVIGGEGERATRSERIGLANQAQGRAGVGREDAEVLILRGVEERQDVATGLLHELRRRQRRRRVGVGIAQDPAMEQLDVSVELTRGVQATPCVVQVDVSAFVEAGILHPSQVRQRSIRIELGEPLPEVGLSLGEPRWLIRHARGHGAGSPSGAVAPGRRRDGAALTRIEAVAVGSSADGGGSWPVGRGSGACCHVNGPRGDDHGQVDGHAIGLLHWEWWAASP